LFTIRLKHEPVGVSRGYTEWNINATQVLLSAAKNAKHPKRLVFASLQYMVTLKLYQPTSRFIRNRFLLTDYQAGS